MSSLSQPGRFATTRWSIIRAAGGHDSPAAADALAALCEAYWYPVYAFIRRQGRDAADAADLTQGFFCRLIEKHDLGTADPGRGRFRSYLLASVRHYLANEYDRATAAKRGGGARHVSLDLESAEGRYQHEPADELTPERLYERRWALTVLDRTLERLRAEYESAGKGPLFDELRGTLTADGEGSAHAESAARLEMSVGAVKTAAHRLRRRYRDLLRAEIGETVTNPADLTDELRDLFRALGRS
jgi:RNA polymerase sigma factor (sigma-70 family)